MNYQTHNETNIEFEGTSLQGSIHASYEDLVQTFGQPIANHPEPRIEAEWIVLFENGTVATIYNWKNGKKWLGPSGTEIAAINKWNIGGTTKAAFTNVVMSIPSVLA